MTLRELFELIGNNPAYVIGFFLFIPICALIAGFMGKNEGHLSPWKYFYSTLVYMVCIPGIFAITLNIYMFLFDRGKALDTDIYFQILPIISMIITLLIIRNNVNLEKIPGFKNVSGLLVMIFAVFALMWGLDRTRIFVIAFVNIPFYFLGLIFIGLLLIVRFGWTRLMSPTNKQEEN
ncbi:MAG: hypothetical protein ACI8P3_000123 [Saprospiraceae bacterium]|jgi:hypothetical protein